MPRKSLATERSTQIIAAFERCVVRQGLGATSLEKVAEEAGVKRSIIRHYVGNREDLVRAMAAGLAERFRAELVAMADYVGERRRIPRLLDVLFPNASLGDPNDVVLIEALISAADADAEIRAQAAAMIEETITAIRDILKEEHPDASAPDLWATAQSVAALYFNHESLRPLALPDRHRRAARGSAKRLIAGLK